jgi:hypothetical protein
MNVIELILPAIDRMPFSVNFRAAAGLKQKDRVDYVNAFFFVRENR